MGVGTVGLTVAVTETPVVTGSGEAVTTDSGVVKETSTLPCEKAPVVVDTDTVGQLTDGVVRFPLPSFLHNFVRR